MGRITRMFNRDDDEVLGSQEEAQARAVFEPVDTEGALDAVFAQAADATTLLFLHDPYCPISSHAFEQVERVDATVHIIDVSRNSALGKLVQVRTGIKHESPQAIVFKSGEPAWHASHGRIRAESLREALAEGQ